MTRKSRRLYKLRDIEKMLVFSPIFFILILSIVSFIVSSFILDFNKKSKIELITQKAKLQNSYENNQQLQNYVNQNVIDVNFYYKNVEKKLMLNISEIKGTISGLISNDDAVTIGEFTPFLKKVEKKNSINFVIFEKKSHKIIYGLQTIKNIQKLIFNNYNNPRSLQLTLLYITSQGPKSSFYWKNDVKQSIQINYFELDKKTSWYIGAFSTTDDLKKFTVKTLLGSIKNYKFDTKKHYIYFYDYSKKRLYNFFGKERWISTKRLIPRLNQQDKKKILSIGLKGNSSDSGYENFYNFPKYSFGVGIKTKHSLISDQYAKQKEIVKEEFRRKKLAVIIVISIFTIILIISSLVFANFIKKVFSTYNKRFENKNRLLRVWKERYELAIIASNDGLWDINFKTGKIFFSNTWLSMFGYKRGDINSYDDWLGLIHKDDRENVEKIMNEHQSGKRDHFIAEFRVRTRINRYKWVLSRGKIFYDLDNEPERLLMMAMNIVERKRIEKNLDDTWRLTKEGDIVLFRWTNDSHLSVTFASKSIERFGYIPDDLLQKTTMYTDIIYKEDLPMVMQSLREHIEAGLEGFSCIYRIIKKDNSEIIWVFSHAIFIKDDFGRVTDLYGYIYDINTIKQTEQELESKVKEEVAKNIAKDRLLVQQNKLAAMGEMIGAIAHQWRQPLNNISLILHFIRDNYDNKKLNPKMISDYIDKGKKQIDYMSHTIDDFRNFYKPSKEKAEFSLKDALISIKEIGSSELEKKELQITMDIEDMMLISFENEFKQAVLNIISNAKDAIYQKKERDKDFKGVINIIGRECGDKYEIVISNNADKIKEEIMDRMFEPYFTTKFEKQGTGIGLYMTRIIVENSMLGLIEVNNAKDSVEFKIILPIKEKL